MMLFTMYFIAADVIGLCVSNMGDVFIDRITNRFIILSLIESRYLILHIIR